jgi:DNA-binding transcriptional ArsR family regulator
MTSATNMAEIAALIGDPGRANMLGALMSGRALTATELAAVAGVSRPTASEHLAKLAQSRLISLTRQGRHHYYRLTSAEVARMLEAIMAVSADRDEEPRRTARRIDPALREARTCYDHLAGRLGVSLAGALIAKDAIVLSDEAGEVTCHGRDLFRDFGVALEERPSTKRLLCRPCLDWSERRLHLAGRLGAALQARLFGLGWIERLSGRAVMVTPAGRHGLLQTFGLDF